MLYPRGDLGFFDKMPAWFGPNPSADGQPPQPPDAAAASSSSPAEEQPPPPSDSPVSSPSSELNEPGQSASQEIQEPPDAVFIENENITSDDEQQQQPSSFAADEADAAESDQDEDDDDDAEDEAAPTGGGGGGSRRRKKKAKKWNPASKISMRNYYSHRLHWRQEGVHPNNHFSPLHHARRLFQQYCVDAFTKVEENSLSWVRSKAGQKQLRAETYSKLQEFVNKRAAAQQLKAGKPVILPSTFIGGKRQMAQEYMDAMAIARKKGSLDLFITMTSNPNWEEVTASLRRDVMAICSRKRSIVRI